MRIFTDHNALPDELKSGAVAIGNFDGVHLGHQEVIGEAGLIAKTHNRPWIVLTFEPHPRSIFTPEINPFRITPAEQKMRLIAELGVDALVVLKFDKEFSKNSAEEFIDQVLMKGLGASHVVCGYNFYFGARRRGNPDMLLHAGRDHGFGFTCVNPIKDGNGIEYSSTRVRDCLVLGDLEGATRILGHPFEICGTVIKGDQRGRKLNYPTCNIALDDYLPPKLGAYAVYVAIEDHTGASGKWLKGMCNIGHRPTFHKDGVLLETHIFDFNQDLYGQQLRVRLVKYLREERKFNGPKEIEEQLAKDCISAKEILKKSDPN